MISKYVHYPTTELQMRKMIIRNEIETGELAEAPFYFIKGGNYA